VAAANRVNLGLPAFAGVSRAAFDARVRRTDALLARIAPPAIQLDASSLLCGPAICMATMDGRSLYRDDNHLNELGGEFLVQGGLFNPLFAP
jgi:hypothetical protein